MINKIVAGTSHTGGANAIIPVINELRRSNEVILLGAKPSKKPIEEAILTYQYCEDDSLENCREYVNDVLDKENPDLVVSGTNTYEDRNGLDRELVISARQRNIPSVSIMDMGLFLKKRFNDFKTGKDYVCFPDILTVPDEGTKLKLKEYENRSQIIVAGNPEFDSLENKLREFETSGNILKIRKEYCQDSGCLIYYAGGIFKNSGFSYWDLDAINMIREGIEKTNGPAKLVFNLHPRMPEEQVKEIDSLIANDKRVKRASGISGDHLMYSSDLTVGAVSTLVIKAALLQIPSLSLQPGAEIGWENDLTSNTSGASYFVNSKSQLNDFLRGFIPANDRQAYMDSVLPKRLNYVSDGKSTQRIVEIINNRIGIL
ncbi:MAG: DUF354 domain-containing protein [Candidatus Pacearchaeota archaeon]|jgi:hypothetical protein